MAVDRKADHYTSARNYTDLDGQSKSFTFIDHDRNTSRLKSGRESDSSKQKRLKVLKQSLSQLIQKRIDEILQFPATSVLKYDGDTYEVFIERHPEKGIIWRERMVKESLKINETLRYNISLAVWRGTVKFEHWWDDMSHEDIMTGKWKEWV